MLNNIFTDEFLEVDIYTFADDALIEFPNEGPWLLYDIISGSYGQYIYDVFNKMCSGEDISSSEHKELTEDIMEDFEDNLRKVNDELNEKYPDFSVAVDFWESDGSLSLILYEYY